MEAEGQSFGCTMSEHARQLAKALALRVNHAGIGTTLPLDPDWRATVPARDPAPFLEQLPTRC
jgi:hypothetical protein